MLPFNGVSDTKHKCLVNRPLLTVNEARALAMLNGVSTLRLQRVHVLEPKSLASKVLSLANRFLVSQMLELIKQLTRGEANFASGASSPNT